MIPGPTYVYKCPNCGNLLTKESLTSGNTFIIKIYSDGKRIAPMLPEFPNLTKCKKCNTIFWLSKLETVGEYKWDDKENSNWINEDRANFLNIGDYFRALKEGLAENIKEEIFIRKQIWWAYNHRVRFGKASTPYRNTNDEIKWKENCNKLISLLYESDLSQRITIAELKRNLGDFEGCLEIIKKIDDNDKLSWVKDKFIDECKRGNRCVVKLK